MGYRSDVTIALYTRKDRELTFPALKLWFEENYPDVRKLAEWDVEVNYGEDSIVIWYQGWKWYDDAPHIEAVGLALDRFVDTFDTTNKDDYAYESIRIGEEPTDIDFNHSEWCDWRLDVNRTITFN